MRILHVMSHFPFPPDNGARADIWSRIVAMKSLGYSIDAVVMAQKLQPSPDHIAEVRRFVDTLEFVERRPLRKCLATRYPTFISRNASLSEHKLKKEYDVTIMEAEDTCAIIQNPTFHSRQTVLRVHNDEIAYLRDYLKREENIAKRQFLRLELMRLKPFMSQAHKSVDQLWFISQAECQRFIGRHPDLEYKAAWLPPSIEIRQMPRRVDPNNKRVLFVGNFYTPLNRDGLRWYLEQVHPVLERNPDYEFVVAGSTQGREQALRFAEHLKGHRRCTVHVDIPDPTPLYEQCTIFVNPMRAGAGVKLKSVHAIEHCIPVVSTSIGNEGTGFHDREHLKIADTAEQFAGAISDLLDDRSSREGQVERAYSRLLARYDSVRNISQLIENANKSAA